MTVTMEGHSRQAAVAVDLIMQHTHMVAELDRLTSSFALMAPTTDSFPRWIAVANWIRDVLIPHTESEEQTCYRAASSLRSGRLLVDTLLTEHRLMRRLVGRFNESLDPVQAAAYGRALFEVFTSHQHQENEFLLPMLVEAGSMPSE
jgi:hypothetical protein